MTVAENEPDAAPPGDGEGAADDVEPAAAAVADATDRRVTVHNALKFLNDRAVRKMTDEWQAAMGIEFVKVKKPPRSNWIQITLAEPEQVPVVVAYVNDNKLTNKKGGVMYANRAADADRTGKRKRGRDADERPRAAKRVKDVVTPLWRQSYLEEQLPSKTRDMIRKSLQKIAAEVKSRFKILHRESKKNPNRPFVPVYRWLKSSRPVTVLDVIPAVSLHRNKCEFTFGYRATEMEEGEAGHGGESKPDGADTKVSSSSSSSSPPEGDAKDAGTSAAMDTTGDSEEPTKHKLIPAVGFTANGWAGGVSRPHQCANIPPEVCAIVDSVDDFLRTSPMPPYDSKTHRGFWRYLTVRTSRRTGQCMLIVVHAPATGGAGTDADEDYSEHFDSERDRLVGMLTGGPLKLREPRDSPDPATVPDPHPDDDGDKPLYVTSIFFQEFIGLSNPKPEHPVQHVFGQHALQERLGKCMFQISPGAFFQINTAGAERLYQIVVDKIREMVAKSTGGGEAEASDDAKAAAASKTLLLDVCCGTGTIGLTCLKEGVVGRVVGVDISEPAIDDARFNAQLNGYACEEATKEDGYKADDEKTVDEKASDDKADDSKASEDKADDSKASEDKADESEVASPEEETKKETTPTTSTRFVAARAEHVLQSELYAVDKDSRFEHIVAVVDPAREGLHQDVVRALRQAERIQRIVYVSCNPTGSLVKDAGLLCAPPTKKYGGRPFRPTSAQPVDMFPLTDHCEMVMTFDRMTAEELEDDEKGHEEFQKNKEEAKKNREEAKEKAAEGEK